MLVVLVPPRPATAAARSRQVKTAPSGEGRRRSSPRWRWRGAPDDAGGADARRDDRASTWCWSRSSTSRWRSAPVTGMLAGTVGGLAQDALAGGIVGIGGMSKTIVGFAGRRARRAVQPVDAGAAAGDVRRPRRSCTRCVRGAARADRRAAVRAAVVGDADPGAGQRPGRRRRRSCSSSAAR